MIPRIIHQSWKDENIPEKYIHCVENVKKLNPTWEYKFWTDTDIAPLLIKYDKEYNILSFLKDKKKIITMDIHRLCLLLEYGGIYLDIDFNPKINFNNITEDLLLVTIKDENKFNLPFIITNCIIGSEKNSSFIRGFMRFITNNSFNKLIYDSHKHSIYNIRYMSLCYAGDIALTKYYTYFNNNIKLYKELEIGEHLHMGSWVDSYKV